MALLPDLDFSEVLDHLLKLTIAFVLALPVAWDRERSERSLGLRTFPLVAMASAAYILLGRTLFGANGDAMARIIQGLMTGIGFLGGGAIVKRGVTVHGTATAASIWSTAALGAAVACDRVDIAVAISLVTFAVLRGLTPLKDDIGNDSEPEAGGDPRGGPTA